MNNLFNLPIFGVFLTLLVFYLAQLLKTRFKYVILNPVLIAITLIIVFLLLTDISFEDYNKGGQFLSFFLGPSIVALGVLFFEKYKQIKNNIFPFLIAISVGGVISILSVTYISIWLHAPEVITRSLVSKSVTTPIAIEITKVLDGIPSITAGVVIFVGIIGNAFGPATLRLFGIKSELAIGTALGTAAHGIGTARALEEGKLTGAYSGLAMCFNGLITAMISPYLAVWILNFMR